METLHKTNETFERIAMHGINPQDQQFKWDIPLKNCNIDVNINNLLAVIDLVQTFYNNGDQTMEVTLKLPIPKEYSLGELNVQIGDNFIQGKIMEKQKAQVKYEDAIAQGYTAALATENKEEKEILTLNLGNLLPGQQAIVHYQFLHTLRIEFGSYFLGFPIVFFPDPTKSDYQFEFNLTIKSDQEITYTSLPKGLKIKEADQQRIQAIANNDSCKELINDLEVYYKTKDMEQTVLLAQESLNHKDEVACIVSFVPSFVELQVQPQQEIVHGEKPEEIEFENNPSCFIFIVDRSGSMSGAKMETTKKALILFLKSLPSDCMFDIISFGSTFEHLGDKFKGIKYSDLMVEKAINEVSQYRADLGGTEIYEPLLSAIYKVQIAQSYTKKIFLLTDGDVSSPDRVTKLADEATSQGLCKIHTFGVGYDCGKRLVKEVAKVGKGECNIVYDSNNLKPIVIKALAKADQPCYENCRLNFNKPFIYDTTSNQVDLNSFQVYRNQLFVFYGIISKDDFEQLSIRLKSDTEKKSKRYLEQKWKSSQFSKLKDGNELFKVITRHLINNDSTNNTNVQSLSLKYQVLSKETAFICVNKNDGKPIDELKSVILKRDNKYEFERGESKLEHARRIVLQTQEQMSMNIIQMLQNQGAQLDQIECCSQELNFQSKAFYKSAKKSSGFSIPGAGIFKGIKNMFNKTFGSSGATKPITNKQFESLSQSKKLEVIDSLEKEAEMNNRNQNSSQEESKTKSPQRSSSLNDKPKTSKIQTTSSAVKQQALQKPILDDLLMAQSSSSGFWNNQELLLKFVVALEDLQIQEEVKNQLKDQSNFDNVWLTLVALWILKNVFNNNYDEWQLIAKKGKKYVTENGIEKVDTLISRINLKLK